MPRRTDEELGRLVREALKGKRLRPRRKFDRYAKRCTYLESDSDFLLNNNDAAVALIEALIPKKGTPSR
jgi:hypothetical protein